MQKPRGYDQVHRVSRPGDGFAVLDCQRIGTPVRVVGDIFDPKAGEDIIVHL